MRTLTETLKAAQKAASIDALVKVVLTHGVSSYTYTRDRILDIKHTEEPYTQRAELKLDNSDGALTSLDLKGYQAVISYGAVTTAGEEYSACAPLWVMSQKFNSSPGKLDCILELAGIPNLMADDKASTSYIPTSADVKTVKTLSGEILGATLACFNHCAAYEVAWDSEDGLIDSLKPRDSFRIYVGGSRLAAVRRLLSYTKCVMRAGADGSVHIFEPVTTGAVYDYEYSLESGHTFFSKAYRHRLVVPNYIVVMSQPDDEPQYSGHAQDNESYALLPKRDYEQMRLESDAQAASIAGAILAGHRLWSEAGDASVPLNAGAEVFDYVKVTDERENDFRIGTLGSLTRRYTAGSPLWRMTFSFGSWTNVRKVLASLGLSSTDELEEYFTRLKVKDLYAENIQAENLDMVWLDPDGNVDLSQIGDNLDNLPDGETYARVKSLHLDAGQVKLDENIFYKAGYDPTAKFDLAGNSLDDIPEGATYQRVLSTQLEAGKIKLSDQCVFATGYDPTTRMPGDADLDDIPDGPVYARVAKTDIEAGHIKLSECAGSTDDLAEGGVNLWDTGVPPSDLDDLADGATYGRTLAAVLDAGKVLLSEAAGDIDDIADGALYGRVAVTDISAGHILLAECLGGLDDIAEGESYGKVLLTDISSGHIKLSSTVEDATYKKYTSTEQGKLGGVESGADVTGFHTCSSPDVDHFSGKNLDDLPNGATYQRVRATDISSGHIKLTSSVVVSGHWYSESGVDIDATAGVTITGGKLTLKDSGGAHSAQLYIDTSGHLRLDMWDYVETQSIVSKNDGSWTLGASNRRFHSVYAKYHYPSTDGGFIFLTSAAGTEGSIKIKGAGSGDIYVYSSGAWRTNT